MNTALDISPQALAEIAFDLATQTQNFSGWKKALEQFQSGGNELIESFFDAMEQFGVSEKERITMTVLFDDLVKKHSKQRVFVVLDHEGDNQTRPTFIESIEMKMGALPWTFDANKKWGAKSIRKAKTPILK